MKKILKTTTFITTTFISVISYAQCDSTCFDGVSTPIFNWNMTTEVATMPKQEAPPPPTPTTLIPQPPAPAAYVPPAGWVSSCMFDSNNYVAKNVFSTTVVNEGNTIYNHNYVVSAIEPPFNTAYVRNGNIIELIGALNTNNVSPQYGARTYHQGPVKESGSFPTRPNVNGPIAMKTSGAWSVHSICNYVEPPPPPPPPPPVVGCDRFPQNHPFTIEGGRFYLINNTTIGYSANGLITNINNKVDVSGNTWKLYAIFFIQRREYGEFGYFMRNLKWTDNCKISYETYSTCSGEPGGTRCSQTYSPVTAPAVGIYREIDLDPLPATKAATSVSKGHAVLGDGLKFSSTNNTWYLGNVGGGTGRGIFVICPTYYKPETNSFLSYFNTNSTSVTCVLKQNSSDNSVNNQTPEFY